MEMRDFFTVARIKQTLKECEELGINTLLARADNHIRRLLAEYWNEGGTIQWIAQTAHEMRSLHDNIITIAQTGAKAAFIQGTTVDEFSLDNRLDEIRPLIDLIHSGGMAAGVGSHNPRVIRIIEEEGWDVDFYVVSFYDVITHDEAYLDADRHETVKLIREIQKPCIAIKVLAAGRTNPEDALRFAFENIKPSDAVAVGTYPKERPDEMRQNVALYKKYGSILRGARVS
ncbi:MAG: hypothetical protein C4532_13570 [Candidatus Abyssobacteria bacterium SURF_17]|uniref:Uncharacterized protein n=1 Tax=Candidatus Abyssobacteria bacterium SURF_17 TaxID=2093361 RepID=A0A419EUV6_9BACT|nr:MAG: hypothetical protein C4532_13570 [Candidatus Abyssubacteria bacterium SURF_17]